MEWFAFYMYLKIIFQIHTIRHWNNSRCIIIVAESPIRYIYVEL